MRFENTHFYYCTRRVPIALHSNDNSSRRLRLFDISTNRMPIIGDKKVAAGQSLNGTARLFMSYEYGGEDDRPARPKRRRLLDDRKSNRW